MSIDDAIAELYRRHLRLNAYLQEVVDGSRFSPARVAYLLRLHSRSIYRIVRLLRVRRARTPTPDDVLQAAINQALDELSEDLGVEL